jgi:hypothetical protein
MAERDVRCLPCCYFFLYAACFRTKSDVDFHRRARAQAVLNKSTNFAHALVAHVYVVCCASSRFANRACSLHIYTFLVYLFQAGLVRCHRVASLRMRLLNLDFACTIHLGLHSANTSLLLVLAEFRYNRCANSWRFVCVCAMHFGSPLCNCRWRCLVFCGRFDAQHTQHNVHCMLV